MPQEIHLFLGKLIFCLNGKEFIFSKLIQNIFQVFHVLVHHLGIQQDVINVNDHELIQHFMED
jgi:hypothetical protein